MATYSGRKRFQSESELEAIATKPTIIDDLLSDYYDIEVIGTGNHLISTDEVGSCYIHLTKGFLNSIIKSKKNRISHQVYPNILTYKFTIKFRPNKKYVQHLEGVYKLISYSVDLPMIPIEYFNSAYYYFNNNENELITVVKRPEFTDKLYSFLYESIKRNTTIFQSTKIYGRVVDEIGKALGKLNTDYLAVNLQQSRLDLSQLTNGKTRIDTVEWNISEIYKTFLNDLESGDLPDSLGWYVGVSEDEIVE